MRRLLIILNYLWSIPGRILSNVSLFARIVDCRIDKTAVICSGNKMYHTEVGRHTYISKNGAFADVTIGNFCSIATNCYAGAAMHMVTSVSTSPIFNDGPNAFGMNLARIKFDPYKPIVIGNDVWIGHNVIIKGGVSVGTGAIIGAGSIVTKNVEAYSIVAGNPAKEIRKRFDEPIIQGLLETQWWNWTDEKLSEFTSTLENPQEFLEQYRRGSVTEK